MRLGERLGIPNLGSYPTLVTICRALNKRHGTIHTDSKSKVATALLYLNASWPDTSDGCLRFLNRIDDIDDLAAPEMPTAVRRSSPRSGAPTTRSTAICRTKASAA